MKTLVSSAKLDSIVDALAALPTDTLIIVSDTNVWSLYGERFQFPHKRVIRWISRPGEVAKSFQNYEQAAEYLLEKGLHRRAHLVAIGGGVVSDFAGFLASTLLRGIAWSVIPTSVIGMVDAAIGGKVAINSTFGKNLIGHFHFPTHVWMDENFLKTLPQDEIQNGHGEVLKMGLLSRDLYDHILQKKPGLYEACAAFKLDVVRDDALEKGKRKILNFGHSYGHAYEKAFAWSHGIAVAWGIHTVITQHMNGHFLDEYETLRDALGIQLPLFPTSTPWKHFLRHDKKAVSSNAIDIVVLDSIGHPRLENISL